MIRVLQSGIHRGEEPCVHGNARSGLIVISGCHLSCRFCYTPETSVHRLGKDHTVESFIQIIADLLAQGALNINMISPSHVWTELRNALLVFRQHASNSIPLVLKYSGFEPTAQIRDFCLLGDVLVPDFKVWSEASAEAVGLPKSYGKVALQALTTAMLLKPDDCVDGKLVSGVIVRHLVMPGFEDDSSEVIQRLVELRFSGRVNLMTSFIDPAKGLCRADARRIHALCEQAVQGGLKLLLDGKPIEEPYVQKAI